MANHREIVVVLLLMVSVYRCFSEPIPVLIWSSDETSVESARPLSRWRTPGDVMDQVEALVEHADTVLVVTQPGVGFSELAKYGGGYGNNQTAQLKNMKSLSGEFPFLTVESLVEPYDMVKKTLELKDWKLERGQPGGCSGVAGRAFLVDLAGKTMEKADDVLGDAVHLVEGCGGSFLVLYMSGSEQSSHRSRRHWNSVDEDAPTGEAVFIAPANSSGCAMLYFQSLHFSSADNDNVTVKVTRNNTDPGSIEIVCPEEGSNMTYSVSFSILETNYSIKFEFPLLNKSVGFWGLRAVVRNGGWQQTLEPASRQSFAALGSSFHCFQGAEWVVPGRNLTSSLHFTVRGLQVQVGTTSLSRSLKHFQFANSYDCEPYFSAAVWTGVLALAPMVIVLYCALVFMFSMDTPDRFDNPVGKPLQINVS